MKLSYVIATRNRRESLLKTLQALEAHTCLPRHMWEVIVVDNASDDDTVAVLSHDWRDVRVIRLEEDEGTPARNHGLKKATGRFICFLNDDTYPASEAIPKALNYLTKHTRVGAVAGRLVSTDGVAQAPALPAVATGGATVYRSSTLKQLGGFAPEFFSQAEEYELSFRLWGAGHRIERFEDIVFACGSPAAVCRPAQAQKLRLRNLLIVVERYIPRPLRQAYRRDFTQRYAALAMADGHPDAMNAALREGRVWARRERGVGRKPLPPAAVESIFEIERQAKLVAAWAKAHSVSRVAIADLGLNIHATWTACKRAGLKIRCIADGRPEFLGLDHLGVPVVSDSSVSGVDGVVLSTINPSQVARRYAELNATLPLPILKLWEPKWIDPPTRPDSTLIPSPEPKRSDLLIRSVA